MSSLLRNLSNKASEILSGTPTPEKNSEDKSRIIMLVDETGSMSCNKAVTISSYNEWLDSNRTKEEDEDHFPRFTLVKFNTTCRMNEHESVEQAPSLTESNYNPNNMTALYDAIGETLTQYRNEKDNIMVIITDGMENSSRKFTQAQIQKMIKEYTDEKGWIFHYLGANQDAWSVGQSIGIMKAEFCNSYVADSDGFEHVWKQNAVQTKAFRGYQAKKKKGHAVKSLMEFDVPTIEKKTSSAPVAQLQKQQQQQPISLKKQQPPRQRKMKSKKKMPVFAPEDLMEEQVQQQQIFAPQQQQMNMMPEDLVEDLAQQQEIFAPQQQQMNMIPQMQQMNMIPQQQMNMIPPQQQQTSPYELMAEED